MKIRRPFDGFDKLTAGRLRDILHPKGLQNVFVGLLGAEWLGDQDSNLG